MANPGEDASLNADERVGSEEVLHAPYRPTGGSNSRALKVAGLTTLACLLLASQVFTAYMVFGQKQQISQLQSKSDNMAKDIHRSSRVSTRVQMQRPMNLPMMMNFVSDEDTKPAATPAPKVEQTTVSVEEQLKDLIKQDPQLPQFNKTFLDNLQSLKNQMNESEWQAFESWMRNWLIFQMAQEHKADSVSTVKSKCQEEAASKTSKVGSYKPQCDEQGRYKPRQCWHATGYCWCVDSTGTPIEGTTTRGFPDCQKVAPH